MRKLIEFLKDCHHLLQHPAHKAEQPLHVIYFILVGWYAGGPYGVAAFACGVVTVLAWGDNNEGR